MSRADNASGEVLGEAIETFSFSLRPHPLHCEVIDGLLPVGCTLGELGLGPLLMAEVNGQRIEDPAFMPAPNDQVVLKALVAGEGGKQVLSLVALAGLAVLTGGIGAGVIGGLSGFAAAGAALAVGVAGQLALNALIPPPSLGNLGGLGDFAPARPSLTTNNRATPFGAIPRLYGTHRYFPPLAAPPYTETIAGDVWLIMKFCLGYGPLQNDGTSLRIGDTPLANFEHDREFLPQPVGGTNKKLYSRNVIELALADTFSLETEGASHAVVRTSAVGAKRISLEFVFPALLRVTAAGKKRWAMTGLKIEMRTADSGAYTVLSPSSTVSVSGDVPPDTEGGAFGPVLGSTGNVFRVKGREARPHYLNLTLKALAGTAYDIRVTRTSTEAEDRSEPVDAESTQVTSNFTWTVLRTFGDDIAQTLPPGLEFLDLKIKATDQLGSVVGNLSLVASSILPTWNGSSWVNTVTSNPAYICRDMLTGIAHPDPVPIAAMHDTDIKAWAAECVAGGFEFNGIFDTQAQVFDALRAVASTGRGSYQLRDGLHSFVRDRAGLPQRQMFADRNAWDFSWSKSYESQPHALKIPFRDREADFTDAERIVYADGFSETGAGVTQVATVFEDLRLTGVTSRDQAWKLGRYYQAVAKLRPETYVFNAAWENLIVERGDVVGISQQSALLGIGAGRIIDLGAGLMTLDQSVVLQSGKTYQARVRLETGAYELRTITSGPGVRSTLSLSGGSGASAMGDLVAVGETGKIEIQALITKIESLDNLTARITAVPYSPAVFSAGSGAIPPFNPVITRPPEFPPAPVIVNVAQRFVRSNTGSKTPRILVTYRIPSSPVRVRRIEGAIRLASETRLRFNDRQAPNGSYRFDLDDAREDHVIGLRCVGDNGLEGPQVEQAFSFDLSVIGQITLTLKEQINTPQNEARDRSTIIARVTPPAGSGTRFSHAIIEFRESGDPEYTVIGRTNSGNGRRFVVHSDGTTYQVRARAVSIFGVEDESGPVATITVAGADQDTDGDDSNLDSALNVPNLRLFGRPVGESDWRGQDMRVQWDAPPVLAPDKLLDYRVRIVDPATSTVLRQRFGFASTRNLTYRDEHNEKDCEVKGVAGPLRSLRVEIVARTKRGMRSASSAVRTLTNPAPDVSANFLAKGLTRSLRLRFTVADTDYTKAQVFLSPTNGFTPDGSEGGNKRYEGRETDPILIPDVDAGIVYGRVRLFDRFGAGAFEPQFLATVAAESVVDTTPPTVPTGLALSSQVEFAGQNTDASLTCIWNASTDPQGNAVGYQIQIYKTASPATKRSKMSPDTEETFAGVTVGREYAGRVRAKDEAGNFSAWSAVVTHTVTVDTTPPGNVSAQSVMSKVGRIVLTWTNPTDSDWQDVEVHKGSASNFTAGAGTRVYKGRSSRYVDHDVANGTVYWYRLRTVDSAGNFSGYTSAISGTPSGTEVAADTQPPTVPPGLTLVSRVEFAGQNTEVELECTWNPSTDPQGNAVGYQIQIWKTAAPANKRSKNSPDTVENFAGITPGREYTGRVRAKDEAGNFSAWSATVTHTTVTDTVPPINIGGEFVQAQLDRITVGWINPPQNNFALVEWYRSATAGFGVSELVYSGSANTFTDSAVAPATPYWYRARTRNRAGFFTGFGTALGPATALRLASNNVANYIANGALNAADLFGTLVRPVELVASLPTSGNFDGRVAYLTTDKRLYRHDGTVWVNTNAADQIVGQLIAGQISAGAIRADNLIVGDFTNLLENADFELGNVGWTGSMSTTATGRRTGSLCASVTHTSNASGTHQNNFRVSCQPGDLLYGRAWLAFAATSGTPSGQAQFEIQFFGESNVLLSTVSGVAVSYTVTAYTASPVTATAPANTVYAKARINYTFANRRLQADTCVLHRVATSDTIGDGSIIASKINVASLSALSATLGDVTAGNIVSSTFKTSLTGQRVELTAGNESYFFDEFGGLVLRIGISTFGGDTSYFDSGLLSGNPTQQMRMGIRGFSVKQAAVYGRSVEGPGLEAYSEWPSPIKDGIPTGAIKARSPLGGAAIVAEGAYGLIVRQAAIQGGSLYIETGDTAVPTVSALRDTIRFARIAGVLKMFAQTAGTNLTPGNTWVEMGGGASAADITPKPFSFPALPPVPASTVQESDYVRILQVVGAVPISITGGEYQIQDDPDQYEGNPWTTSPGFIYLGDRLRVRRTSSATPGASVSCTVTVGTRSEIFSMTTAT